MMDINTLTGMREVVKSVLVPYSSQEMYQLVADVESYPSFLPWCGGASVRPSDGDGMVLAEVQIQFKGIGQSFTTRNQNQPFSRIDMALHDGPFRSLEGHWTFQPLGETACKVAFRLNYQFSSGLLERLIGPVFEHITSTFVDAFVKRAEALYGSRI